jgi:four helix bundle protein
MTEVKSHKDLDVWKLSMVLVEHIYAITKKFPKEETYGLSLQLRRAGVSVCSNIAEGAARGHDKEFSQFLYIALGSISEIETQLEIARRLGYLATLETSNEMLTRIRKMLIGLIRHITRNT